MPKPSSKTVGLAVVASLMVAGAAALIWHDPSLFSEVAAPVVAPAVKPDPVTGLFLISFRLGTVNGWELDVRADGSGELAHGSAAAQKAVIPPGTYNVPAMRKAVEAAVTATPQEAAPPGSEGKIAYIYFAGATGMSPAHLIIDPSLANQLLEKAVKSAKAADPKTFEELRQRKPLLLPNTPAGAPKSA